MSEQVVGRLGVQLWRPLDAIILFENIAGKTFE
jgi:hypothetical protein